MRVILEFNGDVKGFEDAICEQDDEFNFYDSLFWELDYGGSGSFHRTKHGDIKIKVEDTEKAYKQGFADGKVQGELEAMANVKQGIKNYINNEQMVVDEDDLVKIIMGGK